MRNKFMFVLLPALIGLSSCGSHGGAENPEENFPQEETAMQEGTDLDEEENPGQEPETVSRETEYIPKLLYTGDELEVYAIGNIPPREEPQYTTEWGEQDYAWVTTGYTFLVYDDYLCRMAGRKEESDWYKLEENGGYRKCGGDEAVQMTQLHHDETYRYNFLDFRWNEDGCTYKCRQCVKGGRIGECEDTVTWIHKDFTANEEIHVIIDMATTGDFAVTEGGFLYSVGPEKKPDGKRDWIEIWEYDREKNKSTLVKRIDQVSYTMSGVQTNRSGDIMVILQTVEEDEYGREMDMPDNCTVFTSWDNFEEGVGLDNMEVQYYDGHFPCMMEDRILFRNHDSIRALDRHGQVRDYFWEPLGALWLSTLYIMEGVPFFFLYDREEMPCEAGISIQDLYGNTKSTYIIETVVEDGIEFGLKEVKVEDGIFYGLFLSEEGERGILRELEIPVSKYGVE